MIFGSCHFLFHQVTQRDEPDQIIADMDALTAFSAAFIRCSDIDRLDQLMGRVRLLPLLSADIAHPHIPGSSWQNFHSDLRTR